MFSRLAGRRLLAIEFAAVCAGPILVLGMVLATHVRGLAQRDAAASAGTAVRIAAGIPIGVNLQTTAAQGPVRSLGDQEALDGIVAGARQSASFSRVIIRDESGRVLYSDDHRLIGKTFGSGPDLKAALSGLAIWRPLRANEKPPYSPVARESVLWAPLPDGAGPATRVLEAWVPDAAVAAAAARRTHTVYWLIALILIVLWGALTAIAHRATRRVLKVLHTREEQALTDPLTGLANRAMFQDVVTDAIAAGRKAAGAVILLDLDRFKDVNDSLGHHNGDLLLERIGSRLASVLGEKATVARLGGDEFAVVLPGLGDNQVVAPVARRVLKVLEEPVVVGGLALQVEASLGVALYPEDGRTVDDLLRAADVAMYIAKERRSGHEFYDASAHQDRHDAGRLALIGELRRAMDEAELLLHYQPKVDIRTGQAVGLEALARWNHPQRGLLSPAEFIPLAERSNLLRPMTLFVIDTALRQCSKWREAGLEVTVAVNLSAQNMLDLQLPDGVQHLLEAWKLPPESLELEVSESAIMADHRRSQVVLARLSEIGVKIAIDNFGTGYSSLAYLQDLPVGAIKIDRSFVTTMDTHNGNAKIVESTIELGHGLGLTVVAEGVESIEACTRLTELGCDYAQGYFLSRPMPADKATLWLETFTRMRPSHERSAEVATVQVSGLAAISR